MPRPKVPSKSQSTVFVKNQKDVASYGNCTFCNHSNNQILVLTFFDIQSVKCDIFASTDEHFVLIYSLLMSMSNVMPIKILSQTLINQIAAGEVIERPASVIKELVENAIDAGATKIIIKIADAGKSFISIEDNGCGMDADSLKLCTLSHATSKLSEENLFNIHTLGFRGEALSSITAISRITITSAISDGDGYKMQMDGVNCIDFSPANKSKGTTIEVRDLFFATPARLKFLKSDVIETDHCRAIVHRIALANKYVHFELWENGKKKYDYPATDSLKQRVIDILGESFADNLFYVEQQIGTAKISGYLSVPTFNKSSPNYQYFFVNNRFVKDKIFFIALKSAYNLLVPTGRYPAAVLFLDIPTNEVDVNVHPTKVEVRFKNEDTIRKNIIFALRDLLSNFGGAQQSTTDLIDKFCQKISDTNKISPSAKLSNNTVDHHKLSPHKITDNHISNMNQLYGAAQSAVTASNNAPINRTINSLFETNRNDFHAESRVLSIPLSSNEPQILQNESQTFGRAICQINNMYIVAVKDDNLIIIDQHAVAERITLETLQNESRLPAQELLLPEVCNLTPIQIDAMQQNLHFLNAFGIYFEQLAPDLVVIKAIPNILSPDYIKQLISDIADELINFGDTYTLEDKVHYVMATKSCHNSLRAGKKLNLTEMNALLKQMENTQNIAQCCHGRPSYVVLSIKYLNKLFERC